jgi:hypothetical protein
VKYFLVLLAILGNGPSPAWAFPEMVRHGYVNCTSCHVSPTGGGVLTAYGRELSGEILSTWKKDGETKFAYFVDSPKWLSLGGDFRSIEVYRNTPTFLDARFILMQTDLEAAVTYKTLTLDGSLGYTDMTASNAILDRLISRRYFINYRPTDELSFRFGKYLLSYGINTPDHVIATKRTLQLNDEGTETYNVEAAWLGEFINIYGTAVLGRSSSPYLANETGGALNASVSIDTTYKAGVSYFHGTSSTGNRDVFGPWGILGFTSKFFLLLELDFQNTFRSLPQGQLGLFNYMKLDYEFIQGLHGYLSQELSRADFNRVNTLGRSYGIGMQFFPRPHFEFNLSWQLQMLPGSTAFSDYAWAMLHFYP